MAASGAMLSLLLGLAAAPPTLDAEIRALQAAAEDNVAYRVVESLTTEVGPRLAGSEAEARARAWAVTKLKGLGFDRVWVEPAEVEGWRRIEERAEILSPFPQPLAVTSLGLGVSTPEEGIRAPVVRFESLSALEAAPKNGLSGKIAFVDQAMPRTQDGSGYGATVAIRSGAPRAAAERGALAVLIRSVGTDHHRFPHTGMLRYEDGVAPIPAGAISAPDADQLTRVLARSEQPVELRVVLRTERTGRQPTGNVLAEVRGAEHPEQIILLGAHLDSWDLGTGAVDDGAGVGIVVAAAKLILDKAPRRPARTIRVVLFGAEEVGLVGAKAYAKAHAAELPRHVLAMESDFGAGPVYRLSARVVDDAFPMLMSLQAAHLIRLKIIPGENGRAGGPDLYPLRGAVPIVGLDQDGRDYFDLHHTADDTLDKIDPDSLAQNVAAYATVAWWASETGPFLRQRPEARLPQPAPSRGTGDEN